ncbi:MAG: glucokinase [Deltaproteobacteria bacterium]|nr:glucokinase [Deltaproteobacteria bacterium]MBI3388979.1 glucokinase [Deltaproteobacteria bacterium]
MILAGDVGGTKTVLALFEVVGEQLRLVREATYASAQHASLDEILTKFLRDAPATLPLRGVCLGVAGPVIDGASHLINLDWRLDSAALADLIAVPRVALLNDLEAMAYGMLHLADTELAVLNAGTRARGKGNLAVIAAGTGLGEAMLYWDGARHHPIASEGGHVGFAPRSDVEIALLRFLRDRFGGHVSYERVLSGPGLHNIYLFLRAHGAEAEPAWLTEKLSLGDPSARIAEAGLAGDDAVCVHTLALFASIYGAKAGDLALQCVALGGVFVGGGIAPKLLAVLRRGGFMEAFIDKGRFAEVMKSVPVCVALNPRAALLGAAHYARRADAGRA